MKQTICCVILGVVALSSTVQSAAARQPNLILVVADDLGADAVSAYGSLTYSTPHIDRLARDGLRFTHAYVQPFCIPTRLELMTGHYARGGRAHHATLPAVLADAGYKVRAMVGKWHLKKWWETPRHAGFTDYLSWAGKGDGSRYWSPVLDANGQAQRYTNKAFGPDILAAYVSAFLREHRHDQAPWFLYYPMTLPHKPLVRVPDTPFAASRQQKLVDMVSYMDTLVGQLLDDLARYALDRTTVVVFIGDNGSAGISRARVAGVPGTVHGQKLQPTVWGTHVPMILRGPGIPRGRTTATLADAPSILPTLAALAEAETPHGVHGVDVLTRSRPYLYQWYDPRRGDSANRHAGEWVLSADGYKLYRVHHCTQTYRLYNVLSDPGETRPLADRRTRRRLMGYLGQANPTGGVPVSCKGASD